jgi:hypothetical protein
MVAASCGGKGDAVDTSPIFEEITATALPDEAVVSPDPTEGACMAGDPSCPGNSPSFGVGAAAADVDGDGRIDIFLAGPNGGRLYLNQTDPAGTITFSSAIPLGLMGVYVYGAAFGDLDRDGDPDLVLATADGIRILANDGSGVFTDVTAASGVPSGLMRSPSVAVGDIDADGLLDIHLSEYGVTGTPADIGGAPSRLLLNRGDLTFVDVSGDLGWPRRHVWSSLMADFDRDGRLDLLLACETWSSDDRDRRTTVLYNDGFDGAGNLILTPAPYTDDLHRFSNPMGAAVGDLDHDGALEIVLTDVGPPIYLNGQGGGPRDLVPTSYFGAQSVAEATHTFWGVALEDFDRDGHVESMMIAGAPCVPDLCDYFSIPSSQQSWLMGYKNDQFAFEAAVFFPGAGGLSPPAADGEYRNQRGLVRADFGGDGRDELLVTPFNDRNRLYRSTLDTGHYLRVRPLGSVSAPAPYGAEVHVDFGGNTLFKPLASGGSTSSQSEPSLLFELGDQRTVDSLQIRWPSGYVQTLTNIGADQTIDVVEPEFLALPMRTFSTTEPIVAFVQRVDTTGQPVANDDPTGLQLTSSDGASFSFEPMGQGRFRATRPPSATPAWLRLSLVMDGVAFGVQPSVRVR